MRSFASRAGGSAFSAADLRVVIQAEKAAMRRSKFLLVLTPLCHLLALLSPVTP